jgi:hypothetical protein
MSKIARRQFAGAKMLGANASPDAWLTTKSVRRKWVVVNLVI